MDNSLILVKENKLSKAQLQRQRYEESTLNKPLRVRASPSKHSAIKKLAKSGQCKVAKIRLKSIRL